MRIFIVATVLAVISPGAWAQQETPRAYDTIRGSESYRKAIADTYASYESALVSHCAKIDVNMNTSEAKVLGPFKTDANGNIVSGHWRESTSGVACGEKRLYNASVIIQDGKPQVLALFPGHSYASALLQHDAMRYAGVGAGATAECQADILNTELPNGEPSEKSPWDEKWTVLACGKKSVVTMHFIPEGTGTTIKVSPGETVSAP